MDATTKQRLRDWYAKHVGYDPIADDSEMTDAELASLCSGYAVEAGLPDPTENMGTANDCHEGDSTNG